MGVKAVRGCQTKPSCEQLLCNLPVVSQGYVYLQVWECRGARCRAALPAAVGLQTVQGRLLDQHQQGAATCSS